MPENTAGPDMSDVDRSADPAVGVSARLARIEPSSRVFTLMCLTMATIVAVHVGGYYAYGALRGFGTTGPTLAAEWAGWIAILGLFGHYAVGMKVERPALEVRKGIVIATATVAACCWVFLWSSTAWDAPTARSYLFGSCTACVTALTVLMGMTLMRLRLARADEEQRAG